MTYITRTPESRLSVRALACASALALMSSPSVSMAQDDGGNSVFQDEIIITAQRRAESVQNTALAVDALSANELTTAGVTDVVGLSKLVPSLVVQPATGTSTGFYLRGVGALVGNAFTENPVAFNFNEVYIARPAAVQGTFYDLERIEVVKGPQGTLYGRNATGGAINVISKRPEIGGEVSGEVQLEAGNYDYYRGMAALNVPVGKSAALRVAGQITDRDGYLSDGYDDEEGQALRASFGFESGALNAVITADWFKQGGKGRGGVLVPSPLVPGAPNPDDYIGASDPISDSVLFDAIQRLPLPPFALADGEIPGIYRPRDDGFVDNEFFGISGHFDYDLGFATMTVVPAYRVSKPNYLTYNGGYYGRVIEEAKQASIEVRLASNLDGPLQYVLGGYYFDEEQESFNQFVQGTVLSTKFLTNLDNKSQAVFGQATYEIADGFRLLAGARYSDETKVNDTGLTQTGFFAGNPVNPFNNTVAPVQTGGKASFDKLTWKAGAEWDVSSDNLLYANVATGFKSGGFFIAAIDNTFAPEELTAYTIGSKNKFWDNRVTLNIEAFNWDYSDQQVNYIGPARNLNAAGDIIIGSGLVTRNAGKSRIRGVETEFAIQLSDNDRLSGSLQLLDAKYTDFQYLAASASPNPPRTGCAATAVVDPDFPLAPPATTFNIDCSGKPQINTPDVSAVVSYEHNFPLSNDWDLLAGGRTKIESSRFLSIEFLPEMEQGSYTTTDLWLKLGRDNYEVTAYVNNLENEAVYGGTSLRPVFPAVFNILRSPRTYGVRGAYRF